MTSNEDPDETARAEAIEALPAVFTLLRGFVSANPKCPESDDLRALIEACVVGAHRLRLAAQLHAKDACERQ